VINCSAQKTKYVEAFDYGSYATKKGIKRPANWREALTGKLLDCNRGYEIFEDRFRAEAQAIFVANQFVGDDLAQTHEEMIQSCFA